MVLTFFNNPFLIGNKVNLNPPNLSHKHQMSWLWINKILLPQRMGIFTQNGDRRKKQKESDAIKKEIP